MCKSKRVWGNGTSQCFGKVFQIFNDFYLTSGGTSKIWLKEKDDQLIIPQGLRERDFKQMPPVEFKKQGPAFGINAGE